MEHLIATPSNRVLANLNGSKRACCDFLLKLSKFKPKFFQKNVKILFRGAVNVRLLPEVKTLLLKLIIMYLLKPSNRTVLHDSTFQNQISRVFRILELFLNKKYYFKLVAINKINKQMWNKHKRSSKCHLSVRPSSTKSQSITQT